ncbi:ceramide glucosyltransferase [Paracoccus sp. p4-l81]|uniref:ceramide glucosyltransferase n=1 Tax=Paracoccus sp. p4-l81 TaxID=3342806 RepID=UPI0035B8301A
MSALILIGAAAALMVAHLASVGLFLMRLRRQPPPGVLGRPRVTLLRPVCGLDRFDAETLASSFTQDYPDYQVIFCAQSADDPAVALIRDLIARHPHRPARLLIGDDRISANPKLNNVWKGWCAADTDWICMTDSNLLLTPGYLAAVVDSWSPGSGLVSGPPIGTRPDGWGGHLECAFLNGNQARLQFAADSLGFGFAQGKTLFFHRPMIERAGGLRMLGRHLAEDVSTTRLIRDLGLQVRLTPLPFAQPIGSRSLRTVWDRQLRWSLIRREGFPAVFALEPLNGGLVPLALWLSGVIAAGAAWLPAMIAWLAMWYGAEGLLARRAGWPSGPRALAAMALRDLMIPAVWLASLRQRGFAWRGTAMAQSELAAERVA